MSHHGRGDGEGAPPGLGALGWEARQPGAGVLGGKARGAPETRGLGGETVSLLEVSGVKRPVAPSFHHSVSAGLYMYMYNVYVYICVCICVHVYMCTMKYYEAIQFLQIFL